MKNLFLAILTIIRKMLAESIVKKLIVDFVLRLAGIAGGFMGFAAGFAINLAIKFGLKKIKQEEVVIEEDLKATKEQEVYDQVLQNPESTQEDIANAGTDFLK